MQQCNRKRTRDRRAAIAIEFALVFPILLLCVLGIVEIGRGIMVHQVLTNAAREGARRAVIPGATNDQVNQIIDDYMLTGLITGHSRQITDENGTALDLSTASSREAVHVSVSVPYSNVHWGIVQWIAPDAEMSATVVMRKE